MARISTEQTHLKLETPPPISKGMQLRCTRPDGSHFNVNAADVREVIACRNLYQSENLADPISALLPYQTDVLPVRGEIPRGEWDKLWIVILATHGEVVRDIPELRAEELPSEIARPRVA